MRPSDGAQGRLLWTGLGRTDPQSRPGHAVMTRIGAMTACTLLASLTLSPVPAAAAECDFAPRADCAGANAQGVQLGGADLRRIVLVRANLRDADLMDAVLSGARLSRADLRDADLTNAYLDRADLRGANLSGARLDGAYLTGARLDRANLRGVDLRRIQLDVDTRGDFISNLSRARLCRTTMPSGKVENRDC